MRFSSLSLGIAAVACACCVCHAQQGEAARSAVEAARKYGTAVRNCDMRWALECMYPPLRNTYAEMLANRNNPGAEAQAARRIMGLDKKANETPEQARLRKEADSKRLAESNRALCNQYVKMGEDMKKQGIKIESYTLGTPTGEYMVTPAIATAASARKDTKGTGQSADVSRIVIIPTTTVVSAPGKNGARTRAERKSYIYAVRDEVISEKGVDRGTKKNEWYFIDGNTNISTLRTFFPDLPLYLDRPTCGERVLN